MENVRTKVLYIAGEGRSGSTLLGNILGQSGRVFHVGELSAIWRFGLLDNVPCGCGTPFRQCSLWNAILARAFGGIDQINLQEMISQQESGTRTKHIPRLIMPGHDEFVRSRLGTYVLNLGKLYTAIRNVAGCDLIVDSSKSPSIPYLLKSMAEIDPYIVHLVRDPRAVAHSNMRRRQHPGTPIFQSQYHPVRTAARWGIWNGAISLLERFYGNRYVRVRYEDFAANPQNVIRQVLKFVGQKNSSSPFVGEQEVELSVNHTIWGSPSRSSIGRIVLRMDDEWKAKMKMRSRLAVASVTWPFLFQYGYL